MKVRLRDTPEYRVWATMHNRCSRPTCKEYPYYGGRGIRVCERWSKYENFIADMGPRPGTGREFWLEREDNDGNYEPSNCTWDTPKNQNRNSRKNILLTHGGTTRPISEWAEITGLPYQALWSRVAVLGLSHSAALTRPLRDNNRHELDITFNGTTKTLSEWAKSTGMPFKTLWARINMMGWSVDRALSTPVRTSRIGRL